MSQARRKTFKSEKEDRKSESGFLGQMRPHTPRHPPVDIKLVRSFVDFP